MGASIDRKEGGDYEVDVHRYERSGLGEVEGGHLEEGWWRIDWRHCACLKVGGGDRCRASVVDG